MTTKRYWLRGGLNGLLTGLLLGILLLFAPVKCLGECLPLYGFDAFQRNFAVMIGGGTPSKLSLLFLLAFIVGGIFIGWLYGKFRNRNSVENI